MPFYYVTGTPGSGKSSVLTVLKQRGFAAYDTDDIGAFYDARTGQATTSGQTAAERTPSWRKYHAWKIPVEKIGALQEESLNRIVFLCGTVANDGEFWDRFDQVFCLYVPPQQLKRRLLARPGEGYGKNSHELANAVEWAGYAKQQYAELGALIIDAARPLDTVVDQILTHIAKDSTKGKD